MSEATEAYDCDFCGACCHKVFVELAEADLVREPAIRPLVRSCTVSMVPTNQHGREVGPAVATRKALTMVPDGPNESCRFLAGNRCTIHASRPDACREMAAGSPHCQKERNRVGLAPLLPKNPV